METFFGILHKGPSFTKAIESALQLINVASKNERHEILGSPQPPTTQTLAYFQECLKSLQQKSGLTALNIH